MSKHPISEGQMRWHALSCAQSIDKHRCKCRCGGRWHQQPHPEEWIAEEVMRDRIRHQCPPEQTDWVGFAGFERYL